MLPNAIANSNVVPMRIKTKSCVETRTDCEIIKIKQIPWTGSHVGVLRNAGMTLKRLSAPKLTADTQTHVTALITEQTGKGGTQSLNDESCLHLASREIVSV